MFFKCPEYFYDIDMNEFTLKRLQETVEKVEAACKENIIFMASTCSQTPDHSTIAAFVSTMENEISSIFVDILSYCDQNGSISPRQ